MPNDERRITREFRETVKRYVLSKLLHGDSVSEIKERLLAKDYPRDFVNEILEDIQTFAVFLDRRRGASFPGP